MDVLKTSFVDVPSVYVVHFEDFAAVHRDQNCAPFRIPANARNSPVQAPEGAGIELFYPLPQRIPQMHFTIGPKDWVSTRPKPPEESPRLRYQSAPQQANLSSDPEKSQSNASPPTPTPVYTSCRSLQRWTATSRLSSVPQETSSSPDFEKPSWEMLRL